LLGRTRRSLVVSLRGSYHGLTFGGFALTGEDLGQRLYGVDQRLVRHVRPNDTAELNALVSRAAKQIAAVVVEPVVGTGTIPLTDEYVAELLRLRAEHGFLLIADEVATGFGRTGSFFASQRWPEQPDLLITSKGLTNGTCPASAVIVSQRVADAFTEHDAVLSHAETQGATPSPVRRSAQPSLKCAHWTLSPQAKRSAKNWVPVPRSSWQKCRRSSAPPGSAASARCASRTPPAHRSRSTGCPPSSPQSATQERSSTPAPQGCSSSRHSPTATLNWLNCWTASAAESLPTTRPNRPRPPRRRSHDSPAHRPAPAHVRLRPPDRMAAAEGRHNGRPGHRPDPHRHPDPRHRAGTDRRGRRAGPVLRPPRRRKPR